MIANRPINLWLGAITSIIGVVSLALVWAGVDPVLVAQMGSAVGIALGWIIALVANQPPTLAPGDTYTIQTPVGEPNYETTVAEPPAASLPVPVDQEGGA